MTGLPERAQRAATLPEGIAADLQPIDGVLHSHTCGSAQPLGDMADHFRNGWPKCCGLTMTWVTRRQLEGGNHG